MAYLITQPLYLFVMKLIVIYDSLCTICSMSRNRFYVFFQYLRFFLELLEEEVKERMDWLLQP